jgi:hypothetical protein
LWSVTLLGVKRLNSCVAINLPGVSAPRGAPNIEAKISEKKRLALRECHSASFADSDHSFA